MTTGVTLSVVIVLGVLFGFTQTCMAEEPAPVRAGFARTDLTPAVGSEMPGGFGKNPSQGVHDPLWAEAAYFAGNGVELAVVGVDLIMIPRDVVEDARKQAEAKCGIPGKNILIGASHTHNGGPVVECFGVDSDAAYCRTAAEKIAEAVVRARENAVECKIAVGSGHEDSVAFNRRFKMKDGTVRTHPGKMNPDIIEPAGPIDPEVGVIAVEDLKGELLGCVVNYALHGTTMGGNKISADWPCYLRQTVRGGVGKDIGVVFLNGACGDVTQVDNRNPRPAEFGEAWSRRVGMCVGAEVLKVIAKSEVGGFFQNPLPPQGATPVCGAAEPVLEKPAHLAVLTETVPLPIRDLAESDEALVARETPAIGLGAGGKEVYLNEARLVREMKTKSPTVDAEVQVIRIGDAVIASNPGEYFCALGLAIKHGSPWKLTMIAELANGYCGYVPTAEAFQGGGYETRTARSSYVAPGVGEKIAEVCGRLLQQMKAP